jgi:hypothetical protein
MRIETRYLVIAATAATAATAYIYRADLLRLALAFAGMRLCYGALKARLGIRSTGSHRTRTLLEFVLTAIGGVLVGRLTTHPCGQCGRPIGAPSRAEFCSPACRRYARFEREETERRAAALERFGAVPF